MTTENNDPHADRTYSVNELADEAGVTRRTVHYYISQALLPPAGTEGPGTRYRESHLDRLRLIRELQREHLPLAEIRSRLERLNDDQVRDLLEVGDSLPEPRGTATERAAALPPRLRDEPEAVANLLHFPAEPLDLARRGWVAARVPRWVSLSAGAAAGRISRQTGPGARVRSGRRAPAQIRRPPSWRRNHLFKLPVHPERSTLRLASQESAAPNRRRRDVP